MRRIGELLLLALLGLALARLCLLYVDNRWYQTAALVAGTAGKPFVFRQLAPLAVRALMALTGCSLDTGAVWVLQAACIGWLWALRYLAGAVLSRGQAMVATVLAPNFILPWVAGMFVYDVPALALFTLGLALIARRQWAAYLALFPIAMLSRETAVLLTGVYVLCALPLISRRRLALATAYQLVAAVTVKAALAVRFAANPGGLAESHLIAHYSFIKHHMGGSLIALALLAFLVLSLLARWASLPPMLRASASLIPAYFAAYFLLGFPAELRAVLEVYPALFLLVFHLASAQIAALRLHRPAAAEQIRL